MSFFADFVGGAARTLLDERKVALAEKLRKEEEERRRNFQLKLEQRAAERQHDRDLMAAESQRLERDERRANREQDIALALAAQSKKDAAAERRLELDERRTAAYEKSLAGQAQAGAVGGSGGAPQFRSSDIVQLAKALSDDNIPEDVRAAAANAMSVGNYEDAAAILASGKAPTRDPIFIPPPKG